jgi:predicted lipoprotein with Yx(FWY)xxD motif
MRKSTLFAAAPVAAAVLIAGCGGGSTASSGSTGSSSSGSSGSSGAYGAAAPTKAASTAPTVALASSKLGKILVDGQCRTLYLFAADKTASSTCYGACASLWPPLTISGTPKGGPGVSGGLLGTTKRTDGTTEVTYAGHPLYYYAPDTKAGDITGQDLNQFGAKWYVLTANGTEVTHG